VGRSHDRQGGDQLAVTGEDSVSADTQIEGPAHVPGDQECGYTLHKR
jgi:hypothetical protein